MAKTFNRRPLSVSTPSSNEAKDYFFNHANWKGMAVDKNFLAADQETFEDCNNVYVDADGLLRSRPSVKLKNSLTNIVKFWNFDTINIYCKKVDESYQLIFTELNDSVLATEEGFVSPNIKLILKDGRIFVFSDTSGKFIYYDVHKNELLSALDFVYVPETKILDNGDVKHLESQNLLSLNEISTYLYSSDLPIPLELDGKMVKVTIDDIEYSFKFDKQDSPMYLYEKEFLMPVDANYLLIANTGMYVACSINPQNLTLTKLWTSMNGESWEPRYEGSINYWRDFNKTTVGISDDGTIFYIVNFDGLNFLSLTKNYDGTYEYDTFENVFNDDYGNLGATYLACASVVTNRTFILYSTTDRTGTSKYYASLNGNITTKTMDEGTFISADFTFNALISSFVGYAINKDSYYKLTIDEDDYTYEKLSSYTSSYGILHGKYILVKGDSYVLKNLMTGEQFVLSDDLTAGQFPMTLASVTARFSDDGKYVFLPTGIYNIERKLFFSYLNILADQSFIVHRTGNNSYYGTVDNSNIVYSNVVNTALKLKVESGGSINEDFITTIATSTHAELDDFYVGNGYSLYVSQLRKNDSREFLWYFPKSHEKRFGYSITGLQPISSTEMAIFFPSEVWHSSYDRENGLYHYYKSKLQTGLRAGSDIVTSYDGTKVIFPSERGLVSLSYQDFVASTEQVLTYLSDAIFDKFKEFVKNPVKLLKYQHWLLAYRDGATLAYLLDVRNNSWWPLTYHSLPTEFYVVENDVLLLSNDKLFKLDKSDSNYYDYDGEVHSIDWHLTSQKLHFNAVNYVKHISNLTLYAVLDSDKSVNFKMDVKNYRKRISRSEVQTISYRVDVIRTVVKKVNYFKVDEFQYTIKQDDEQAIRVPLSLSGVTIKYSIGGQVR